MALCGKVGLAGVDLIITKNGQVFINEINDRQQGTTENTSINSENHDVPGLVHIAFLQNFSDMTDYSNYLYMKQIKDNSKQIYEEMYKSEVRGPFYIKLLGKDEYVYSNTDLSSGIYTLQRHESGEYEWKFDEEQTSESDLTGTYPSVDLNSEYNSLYIDGIDLSEGQFVPVGTQIGRICGEAQEGSEPFVIDENGHSILNPVWIPIVKALNQQTTCQLSPLTDTLNEYNTFDEQLDFGTNP